MSPEILGFILLGALLIGIFVGFPVAFTLIVLGVVFGYIEFGESVFFQMVLQALGLMKEETLAAVPLFIFMGHILERTGLMERVFNSFQFILWRVKGSLYLGVLLTTTIFATATGIIGASVTVIGMLAVPAMTKSRYDPALSSGVITAGGSLGILIPPSVMLVVMGPVLGISVVHLFAAALIPGLLLAGIFTTYTMVKCYLKPELGPPLPVELRPTSQLQILWEFLFGILPLMAVIFAALGSIIFGLATPTEAAAVAASGSLVLAVLYRRLNFDVVRSAALETLRTSSLIMFLAVASNIYGSVFSRLGTSQLLADWILVLAVPPLVLLVLLMVVIFILGWPLEWPAIVFIFVPIFLPVVQALNFDLLWFGTLLAVNLQTAFLSPPVAMAAYYLKAVAPDWDMVQIYKGMAEFMMLQIIGLAIVFIFPEVALWLPRVLFP